MHTFAVKLLEEWRQLVCFAHVLCQHLLCRKPDPHCLHGQNAKRPLE